MVERAYCRLTRLVDEAYSDNAQVTRSTNCEQHLSDISHRRLTNSRRSVISFLHPDSRMREVDVQGFEVRGFRTSHFPLLFNVQHAWKSQAVSHVAATPCQPFADHHDGAMLPQISHDHPSVQCCVSWQKVRTRFINGRVVYMSVVLNILVFQAACAMSDDPMAAS